MPGRTGPPRGSGSCLLARPASELVCPLVPAERMQGGSPVALWIMIAAGVVVRLVVAFATHGLPYDIHSFQLVHAALSSSPLHLYSTVNPNGNFHWPYPPGYL